MYRAEIYLSLLRLTRPCALARLVSRASISIYSLSLLCASVTMIPPSRLMLLECLIVTSLVVFVSSPVTKPELIGEPLDDFCKHRMGLDPRHHPWNGMSSDRSDHPNPALGV